MHADEFNNKLYCLLCNEEDSDSEANKCLITGEELTRDFITLKCNHSFNYEDLFYEISKQKEKTYLETSKLALSDVKCPYCRTIQRGLIPLNDNYPDLRRRGVNLPKTLTYKPNKCKTIIKSGAKKGEICNKPCYYEHCCTHLKNINKKKNLIKCESILKSGKRKGEQCLCICKTEESINLKRCMKHLK